MQDSSCTFNGGYPGRQWNDCFSCHYIVHDWERRRHLCRLVGLLQDTCAIENPCKPQVELYMYVAYGHYAAPLAWWLNFFPPDRFLILNNEELRSSPVAVANRVAAFMGLAALVSEELLEAHQSELDENPYKKTIDEHSEAI